ncbi:MAG: GAF domain-containing protein [Phycisphaerae bacterium]
MDSLKANALVEKIGDLLAGRQSPQAKLLSICGSLSRSIPYYNWVGFYIVDETGQWLDLGPFVGEPTEHVRIPFGRGICGQAAATGRTFVVQDVTKETNYLSCSLKVKSEIVLPIVVGGKVVAELDIDSHEVAPFTPEDTAFLERVCELVAPLFK